MHLEKQSTPLKYPLFIGGLTAVAGLGYLYYRSTQGKDSSDFELSRKQVIAILKELRKEFYPIFKYLTNLSQTIQNDYKKKFNYIPDNIKANLHVMLIDENPAFKEQVYAMEERVYSKFAIHNRSGFEAYVLRLAKTDADVQALVNEIKNNFRKAVMGVTLTEDINLPSLIEPELILQIYKDSLKLVLQRILSFVADYKERHGEITAYDENFAMSLKNLNLEQMKLQVLEERGLGGFEDYHPERLFHFALAKYSKEDPSFKDRLSKMEVFHQGLMQKLFAPNADISYLQGELSGIDKIAEPETYVIKESKDEWVDVDEAKDEEEEAAVIVVDAQPEEQITIEAVGDDVVITEQTADTTTVTHLINNEVVEQIQEIHIHPARNANDDTFVHAPEDVDIDQSTDFKIEETKTENVEPVVVRKDELIAKTPDIDLVISHDETPLQDSTHLDFVKTGEPVVEVIENNDFEVNEPELKPVTHNIPEIDGETETDKPKLDLE